jgi:predicted Fe-Mo cluster-binding NifX family protein
VVIRYLTTNLSVIEKRKVEFMRIHTSIKILVILIIFSSLSGILYAADGDKTIIAIPSTGTSLDSMVSENLGRSPYILLFDCEEETLTVIENPGGEMRSGAGPRTAEVIINSGATHVVTGKVGERVEALLKKAGIEIVDGIESSMTLKEAIDMIERG